MSRNPKGKADAADTTSTGSRENKNVRGLVAAPSEILASPNHRPASRKQPTMVACPRVGDMLFRHRPANPGHVGFTMTTPKDLRCATGIAC